MTLRRLIGVFARAEHPLALFLDDLQWLDGATLDLLENILVEPEPQHLLLVGAYRDNEVDAAHPLMRKLSAIRESGAIVQEVVLGPLEHEDLNEWFADALHCQPERTRPLAQLVHEKTAGNPFFANQFLQELVEGDLITFDAGDAGWRWDLGPIRSKGYTENVVDLMVGKLSRLPARHPGGVEDAGLPREQRQHVDARARSRDVGGAAPLRSLGSAPSGADRLVRTTRIGSCTTVFRRRPIRSFRKSSVPESSPDRKTAGRAHCTRAARRGGVRDRRSLQPRRGPPDLDAEEREQIAALNLMAGKRAKKAAAFASALSYLVAGRGTGRRRRLERRPRSRVRARASASGV